MINTSELKENWKDTDLQLRKKPVILPLKRKVKEKYWFCLDREREK